MSNLTQHLFTNSEVIKLCSSFMDNHRALGNITRFYSDLEKTENGFVFIGLRTFTERFIAHQIRQLDRIMEIYRSETSELISQMAEDGRQNTRTS